MGGRKSHTGCGGDEVSAVAGWRTRQVCWIRVPTVWARADMRRGSIASAAIVNFPPFAHGSETHN